MIDKRHIIHSNLECYLKFTIRKKFESKFEAQQLWGFPLLSVGQCPSVAPPPVAPSLSPAPYLIRGAGIEKLLPSFQGQQAARSLLVCALFSCPSLHTALLFSMAFITQKTMSSKESLPFPLRVMTDRRLNEFLLLP